MTGKRVIGRLAALRRRLADEAGSVAIVFSLAVVPMLAAAGLAVDATSWYAARSSLQAAADTAAIAAAREMRLANTPADQLEAGAETAARAALATRGFDAAAARVDATVDSRTHSVRIDIGSPLERVFSRIVTDAFAQVVVTATAKLSGSAPICVVALDPTGSKALHLEKRAVMEAHRCGVFSNSTHTQALRVDDQAELHAALICSAGGHFGRGTAFVPTPRTECPPIPDPLAGRAPPAVGPCDHEGLDIRADTYLLPGVYCGGIRISQGARVELGSGLYVIKDGELRVDDGELVGRYTSFYFTGRNAAIDFRKQSRIDLAAMRDGALAGILIFQDRAAEEGRDFKITSDDARTLLGTIYLPRGDLLVDADRAVADESAYTVIVARRLELSAGPVLKLNTDYHATDIPVPDGVGPTGDVVLSQ
ncbi:pilus assembly protein TadG-related protein [Salinarimonas rosea]|uniref:pilus assembly protein TadG-related protein n=1 Tax=Salinarimonas rosea TaxID=552063 RepID=UPI000419D3B9|nr:pilus assembly protein TadG-related protein [Salinarimonas rosea]